MRLSAFMKLYVEVWCLLSLMGTINLTIAQYYEFVKQAVKRIETV